MVGHDLQELSRLKAIVDKEIEESRKREFARQTDADRLKRSPIKKLPKDPVIIELLRRLKCPTNS